MPTEGAIITPILAAPERDYGKSPPHSLIFGGSPSDHDCLAGDRPCSQITWSRLSLATFMQSLGGHGRHGSCTGPREPSAPRGMAPRSIFLANDLRRELLRRSRVRYFRPRAYGAIVCAAALTMLAAACSSSTTTSSSGGGQTTQQQVSAGWQGLNPGTGAPQRGGTLNMVGV